MEYEKYITGGAFIAGGITLGVVLEIFVLKQLIKAALRSKSRVDNIFLKSPKGLFAFWGILGGLYFGLRYLPLGIENIDLVGKILFVALIFSVALLLSRIIVGLIRLKIARTPGLIPATAIISTITRVVVFLIGTLVILQTLGISITPILTALGIGGLAVALALQETLTNFFAGVQVIASRQIRPGDYIQLNSGEEGYVADITWRSTTIRMLSNNLIVVPNSKIASAILTNYYLPNKEMAVLVEVGVSYSSNLDEVEQVTITTAQEVLKRTTGGVKEFEPFIRYHSFNSSNIGFTVILRGLEFTDQYLLKHEFIKALRKAYQQHSIEIPFPSYNIQLQKPFIE